MLNNYNKTALALLLTQVVVPVAVSVAFLYVFLVKVFGTLAVFISFFPFLLISGVAFLLLDLFCYLTDKRNNPITLRIQTFLLVLVVFMMIGLYGPGAIDKFLEYPKEPVGIFVLDLIALLFPLIGILWSAMNYRGVLVFVSLLGAFLWWIYNMQLGFGVVYNNMEPATVARTACAPRINSTHMAKKANCKKPTEGIGVGLANSFSSQTIWGYSIGDFSWSLVKSRNKFRNITELEAVISHMSLGVILGIVILPLSASTGPSPDPLLRRLFNISGLNSLPWLLFLYDVLFGGLDFKVIAKQDKVIFRRWTTGSKVASAPLYVRTGWTYKYTDKTPWKRHLGGNCKVLDIPDRKPLMIPTALVQSVENGEVFLAALYNLEGPVFSGPTYQ